MSFSCIFNILFTVFRRSAAVAFAASAAGGVQLDAFAARASALPAPLGKAGFSRLEQRHFLRRKEGFRLQGGLLSACAIADCYLWWEFFLSDSLNVLILCLGGNAPASASKSDLVTAVENSDTQSSVYLI